MTVATLLLAIALGVARADTDTADTGDTAPADSADTASGQSLTDLTGDEGGPRECGSGSFLVLGALGAVAAAATARRSGTSASRS